VFQHSPKWVACRSIRSAVAFSLLLGAAIAAVSTPLPVVADAVGIGGDTFVSGSSPRLASEVARDVFLGGSDVVLDARVAGDAHLAGFSVATRADVAGDVYAAGGSVTIGGAVGEDLTASGFTVRIELGGRVSGNTRLAGGTISVEAPLSGALVVAGGTVTIDAPVTGDVRVSAGEIVFGENARIGGRLEWASSEEPDIPADVVPAERIRRLPFDGEAFEEIRDTIDESIPELWPSLVTGITALIVTLGFLLVLAAILFAFAPRAIEHLRDRALAHPGLALLAGALGLATLVGALPVAAMTLVGLPLIPFVLLALVVLWTLGYGLGVHVVATRVWHAFDGEADGMVAKLVTLGIALVVIGALNFIPVVGWLVNLAVLLLGLGAMTLAMAERIVVRANDAPQAVRLPAPEE